MAVINPGAQSNALAAADKVTAVDVQDGVRKALTTQSPNQFVMTFEGQDQQGRKFVSPYVKKAGRSVVLNEVAKKKGGLASLRSICVRSAQEMRSDLLDIMSALSDSMKRDFIGSRAGDWRCLSVPDGTALYKFIILFKNGEKWEGEGIANVRNVRAAQLHTRLDEMAETRAFMRCVGRGTADGFITPDQACGSEDWDAAEAELMAEEQGEGDYIDVEEAGPEQGESFRSPDGGGAGDAGRGPEVSVRAEAGDSAEAAGGAGAAGTPADEGVCGGAGGVRQGGGDGGDQAERILAERKRHQDGWQPIMAAMTAKGYDVAPMKGLRNAELVEYVTPYLLKLTRAEADVVLKKIKGLPYKSAAPKEAATA